MTVNKRHPLDVFQATGRAFGQRSPGSSAPESTGAAADSGEPIDTGDADPPRTALEAPATARSEAPASPAQEFELRLRLPGVAAVLLAWVVVLGVAYVYGYRRGVNALAQEKNQDARELADSIAAGSPEDPGEVRSQAAGAGARPYGVKIATYDGKQESLIAEAQAVLVERYGIQAPFTGWRLKDGKIAVFVGEFAAADDPELIKLAADLRKISDWPGGQKSPFVQANVLRHPGDPSKQRAAAGR